MKPEAWKEVACTSRRQAESYLQKQNFGRAFAHFLVALKLKPQWKPELKEQFSSCLCSWGNILETRNRYTDLFTCYEQALEIFADNDGVLNNLGAHLYRSNHLKEALHYFKKANDLNPENLEAFRNLQSVKNLLVERWHFRMLNDSLRNRAFREAIMKKVHEGFDTVLDIGTGTGLLSLFAVEAGAKKVYACDVSEAMINIAKKVVLANNASGKVCLINKMSNDIKIPEDIPQRVSLVVTETADTGLVGEGILQTLAHAWSSLLQPGAQVIPSRACLKVTAVSSLYIASTCRASVNPVAPLLIAENDGPYDTEDIVHLPGGIRMLTEVAPAMCVDFTNQEQLRRLTLSENTFSCNAKCIVDGSIDAAVIWFELQLDDDIQLSSAPGNDSCWDQAVFPIKTPLRIFTGQQTDFRIMLSGGKLAVDISVHDEVQETANSMRSSSENKYTIHKTRAQMPCLANLDDNLSTAKLQNDGLIYVSPDIVKSLNDACWVSAVKDTSKMSELLCRQKILDMSHFPLLGLSILEGQKNKTFDTNSYLVCTTKAPGDEMAIRTWAKTHEINNCLVKCIRDQDVHDLPVCGQAFDLIVTQPFETTGELREKTFSSLAVIRKLLKTNGILLPQTISVDCKLVHSEWIKKMSSVGDIDCTCGYDIADFINEYQVSQHLDFSLDTIEQQNLSEPFSILQMTLTDNLECLVTKKLSVPLISSGSINAIPYWFRVQLMKDGPEFSTLHSASHVKQAAVLIDPEIDATKSQSITLIIKQYQSIIHIELEEH